ncbi:Formylglycine-generating sulfatase enzyme [Botrimarina colliarenosi]|uniref:Formylglycine-generating sulfatase enzyme n=1 Tax=Botrimarina colliarenosi TaxID=2528001 RepID=A0A5C6ALD6_9BACT|nr:SUMF1/EgtB/PvdO family nonheme iron enzyme [Botrimarina colliarenosi]TWU00221.1 Formylglycine-generating sulfatase enzyme [Botrimarina colliarenosi]
MIHTPILTLLLAAVAAQPAAAGTVSFDWAFVGNPGNAGELSGTGAGGFGPDTIVGAVDYSYRISKHEVTNAQYVEFLNAVDPTGANALALYNTSMAGNFGGIELRGGNGDGSKFVAQVGREQNPVTFVSFFDAMRFANWLHNGQGAGDTETGAYTIGSGIDEVRSTSAKYWIPSEDEWYKAAYHEESAGTAGVYFDYAAGSDSIPVSDQPGDNPAAVNYFDDDGMADGFNDGYAVSGSWSFPSSTNPFTDVGAYTAAASPYGTFDQNGNVWEWTEAVFSSSSRGLRGGSWISSSSDLWAAFRYNNRAASEGAIVGFRVATVPETGSVLIAGSATMGCLIRRRA